MTIDVCNHLRSPNSSADLFLVKSDALKNIFGGGHQLVFKDPKKKREVHEKLERLGWSPWGYDGYFLPSTPLEAILKQLQGIFPALQLVS